MPIVIPKKLILVGAKEISFLDKNTNSMVKKWKYTFLTSENKLLVGYDENGIYKDDVKTVSGYDESKAQNFFWELKEFAGNTKEQLYVGKLGKIVGK